MPGGKNNKDDETDSDGDNTYDAYRPPPPARRLKQQEEKEQESAERRKESRTHQHHSDVEDDDMNILPIFSHSNGRLKLLGMNSYNDGDILLTSDIDGDFRANGCYFRPSRSTTSSGNESDFTPLEPPRPFRGDEQDEQATAKVHDTFVTSFDSLKVSTATSTTCDPGVARLEKSGHLLKLGGRFRSWKKRWFVLRDGCLFYYKNPDGKLKEKIDLDTSCHLVKNKEDRDSFRVVYRQGKRTLQLAADTTTILNEWLKAIKQTLMLNNIFRLQSNEMPIIEDHLIKVRFGHQVRCWVSLYSSHLVYFSNCPSRTALDSTPLKDAKVTEIDDEVVEDDEKTCSLSIHPKDNEEPIYLLFHDRTALNQWLHHLKTVAAGGHHHNSRTGFENFLALLHNRERMTSGSREAFYRDPIWNHEAAVYTDIPATEPLTTLSTIDLRDKALKLFKSIQLFITIPINMAAIDYHVSLVQNSLKVALEEVELQSELYYQLIKQSTPPGGHGHKTLPSHIFPCSPNLFHCEGPSSSSQESSPTEQPSVSRSGSTTSFSQIFLQCIQLLSIVISIFLPSGQVLWLLRHHLNRCKDQTTETGKYALYGERALERTLAKGPRKEAPSRMEVLSLLQRNPFQHSLPHSIPVHFANESYQVIGFDGSTTVGEFGRQINAESGIRDNIYSGFALYSDDPLTEVSSGELSLLNLNSKLADVIASWEGRLRKYRLGRFETTRIVKLVYRHRLCLPRFAKNETDRERLLWVYELNEEIVNERFPVSFELAVELMALLMQIEFGDIGAVANFETVYAAGLERFLPIDFRAHAGVRDLIMRKWSESSEQSVLDCVRIYLNCTRRWRLCGARLYRARASNLFKFDDLVSLQLCKIFHGVETIWMAITEGVIEVLEVGTFRPLLAIPHEAILNFGGYRSHFMLVVNAGMLRKFLAGSDLSTSLMETKKSGGGTSNTGQRLLFQMEQSKRAIVDVTMLLADYINMSTCGPFQSSHL